MSDQIIESPAGSLQGWTKLKNALTGGERYRHDETSIVLSSGKYFRLVRAFKQQGFVPVEYILKTVGGQTSLPQHATAKSPSTPVADSNDDDEEFDEEQSTPQQSAQSKHGRRRQQFFQKKTPGVSAASASRAAGGPHINQRPPTEKKYEDGYRGSDGILNLEAKQDSKKTPVGGATLKELTSGISFILGATFLLVSLATSLEEMQLTEEEIKVFSDALAPIVHASKLNQRIGRYVADAPMWQNYFIIGYTICTVVMRWTTAIRTKGIHLPNLGTVFTQTFTAPQQQQQQYQSEPVYQPSAAPTPAPIGSNGNIPRQHAASNMPSGAHMPMSSKFPQARYFPRESQQ